MAMMLGIAKLFNRDGMLLNPSGFSLYLIATNHSLLSFRFPPMYYNADRVYAPVIFAI